MPGGPNFRTGDNMRFWVGFFAIDCFVESFCVLWMAMGGYIQSTCMFVFGWLLHLFVALPYCISTVGIPVVIYSAEGATCRTAMGASGLALIPVYWTHCGLFLVYVSARLDTARTRGAYALLTPYHDGRSPLRSMHGRCG